MGKVQSKKERRWKLKAFITDSPRKASKLHKKMLAHAFALGVPAPHVPAALAGPNPGNARSTALASLASSWTLDPRVYEEPGQFTGCPEGQRNAVESECFAAVQEVTHALGLLVKIKFTTCRDIVYKSPSNSRCALTRHPQ